MTKLTKKLVNAEHHVTAARNKVDEGDLTGACEEYEIALERIAWIIDDLSRRCTYIEGENPHGEMQGIADALNQKIGNQPDNR